MEYRKRTPEANHIYKTSSCDHILCSNKKIKCKPQSNSNTGLLQDKRQLNYLRNILDTKSMLRLLNKAFRQRPWKQLKLVVKGKTFFTSPSKYLMESNLDLALCLTAAGLLSLSSQHLVRAAGANGWAKLSEEGVGGVAKPHCVRQ